MDDNPPAQRFHLVANGNWTEEARKELTEVITPRQPRHFRRNNVISMENYKKEQDR